MKKNIFLAFAVLGLAVLAASTTLAQVQFQSTGGLRQVRGSGETEVVSAVDMLAANTGTIKQGTSITISYAGNITNTINRNNVLCITDAVPTACANAVTVSTSGNQLTIAFSTGDDTFTAVQGRLTVSGVRVDISALGTGTTQVVATISSGGAPSGFAVTFTNPQPQVAAAVTPETTVKFGTGALYAPPTITVLTCTAGPDGGSISTSSSGASAAQALISNTITVTEAFPAALASLLDEQNASVAANKAEVTNGVQLLFTFHNVPAGLSIKLGVAAVAGMDFGGGLNTAVANLATTKSTGADFTITVKFTATDTSVAEKPVFTAQLLQAKGDVVSLPSVSTTAITATLSLGPTGTTATPSPVIVQFNTNTQGSGTLFNLNTCASYVYFPWVTTAKNMAIDTGVAISNSGSDPIGTKGQTGDITLTFISSDGSTTITKDKTSLASLGGVKPGQTVPFTLQTLLGVDFQGYLIAVCNFQFGHGVAFINNPTIASSGTAYVGLELINPRTVSTVNGSETLGN